MTTGIFDPRFSDPVATAIPRGEVERLLREAELHWLTTVRAEGRPHVTPLVGVWHDGAFAFCTGVGEQKQRNVEHHPDVAVTTGVDDEGSAPWVWTVAPRKVIAFGKAPHNQATFRFGV